MPGQRQGNPQLGFNICPHTCGCIITQSIVNKSRKKPDWFKWAPLALKDGRHILKHNKSTSIHPNCDNTCSMLDAEGRDLTHEEWTAWALHLGHYTPFLPHIPVQYQSLFPAIWLEDAYQGNLPTHPLPPPSGATSLQQRLASMSLYPPASTQSTSEGPSGSSMGSTSQGYHYDQRPRFIFVETPRVTIMDLRNITEAKGNLSYDTYFVTSRTPEPIKSALTSAPPNMVFRDVLQKDEEGIVVGSYMIHDMVRIISLALNYFI